MIAVGVTVGDATSVSVAIGVIISVGIGVWGVFGVSVIARTAISVSVRITISVSVGILSVGVTSRITLSTIRLWKSAISLLIWQVHSDPLVNTPLGNFSGLTEVFQNVTVNSYLGIPFALPPLGERRFRKPEPAVLHLDTMNVTEYKNHCVNTFFADQQQSEDSEDCLYLNVFTPGDIVVEDANASVLVWIYGGGFVGGLAEYYDGLKRFTKKGNIVVTFNYRIGPLGFLSTEDEHARGKYGLWEEVLAMKWMKNNIQYFGGDSDNIIIFGESAGSASVSMHTVSRASSGLFQRAIMQSGTLFSPWSIERHPLHYARRLGVLLGCVTDSNSNLMECLRNKPISEIRKFSGDVETFVPRAITSFVWTPVVDGDFLHAPPDQIFQMMENSNIPQCDILIGLNENEGSLASVLAMIQRSKFPSIDYWTNGTSLRSEPVYIRTTAPEHNPGISNATTMGHGADLAFLLDDFESGEFATAADKTLSSNIMNYWSNFAESGDPNRPHSMPTKWPQYTSESEKYLVLSGNMTSQSVRSKLLAQRMALWNNVLPAMLPPV
ncbi:hypothetical protein ScPMuIL_012647 [Solemya velum]